MDFVPIRKQIKNIIAQAALISASAEQARADSQTLLVAVNQLYENTQTPSITIFGQQNPAWAKDNMGVDGGTIAKYGCLICCIASILRDAGFDTDPCRLNGWLNGNNGYVRGANLSSFSLIESFNAVRLVKPVLFTPAGVPFDKINFTLNAGGAVTAMVDFYGKSHNKDLEVSMHWVRILGDNLCMDPWLGVVCPIAPRFGKDATSAIWRVARYERIQVVA